MSAIIHVVFGGVHCAGRSGGGADLTLPTAAAIAFVWIAKQTIRSLQSTGDKEQYSVSKTSAHGAVITLLMERGDIGAGYLNW